MYQFPKAYILVPIYERSEYIHQLIEQLNEQTYPNFELLLIDHSPKTCTPNILPNYVTKLRGTPDMWWSGAMNVGIKHALEIEDKGTESYIVFMNDDVKFDKNLISNLVDSSRKNVAGIGPITIDEDNNKETILDANNFLSFYTANHISPQRGNSIKNVTEKLLDTDILKGRGVIYPIQTVRNIGLTNVKLHYRADPEYSYRAKKSGLKLLIDTSIRVKTSVAPQKSITTINTFGDIKILLFSKKSPLNLHAAYIYFFSITNPILATWSSSIYTIKWVMICTIKLITKR